MILPVKGICSVVADGKEIAKVEADHLSFDTAPDQEYRIVLPTTDKERGVLPRANGRR